LSGCDVVWLLFVVADEKLFLAVKIKGWSAVGHMNGFKMPRAKPRLFFPTGSSMVFHREFATEKHLNIQH
jgi:hypothetical protein